jgi:hypothetical protein
MIRERCSLSRMHLGDLPHLRSSPHRDLIAIADTPVRNRPFLRKGDFLCSAHMLWIQFIWFSNHALPWERVESSWQRGAVQADGGNHLTMIGLNPVRTDAGE